MAKRATKEQTSQDRARLQNPWAHVNGEGDIEALNDRVDDSPIIHRERIFQGRERKQRLPDREIANAATKLQQAMWLERSSIYPHQEIADPVQFLNPADALRCLGIHVELQKPLGQYSDQSGTFEIAGLIDSAAHTVCISPQFLPETRRFTAAHELGHAVLHPAMSLHRDRAIDGTGTQRRKDWKEREADIFATEYLMPAKQVRQRFEAIFHTKKFRVTDDTAFALTSEPQERLRTRLPKVRDLSLALATTRSYGGGHIVSLSEQFNVSPVAMAIRLEELDLVES